MSAAPPDPALQGAAITERWPGEVRRRYAAYRARQAARLAHMIPREAVRPLYRSARAHLGEAGAEEVSDPMAVLVRYCESLLPLPPLEVWWRDVQEHPDQHLADADASATAPSADAPATARSRALLGPGGEWLAHLKVFREDGVWRGFIGFEEGATHALRRTATVFREADPRDILERFSAFDEPTLRAFLRSCLP